ncbi:Ku protein [Nitrospira sp. KM1]|uniref:non-homologous end joining protein Ku n=1 Tax=Nitrospira sp. KM1 TaxID=1936990 RepID=UPI001564CD5A|nr:Ku protein [Nitrospira sp. KM1]
MSASKRQAERRSGSKPRRASRSTSEIGGRPIWTGHIRLSLVSVPIRVYPAVKSGARLAFHQVHGPSGKRIRYEKVAPGLGPVDTDEIFKGFEITKGHYVLLNQRDIDSVKLEAKRTFDLAQFVDHCEIDPIYFDQPYYVAPDGELAEDAYRVLRDALRQSNKMGLGQIVMRTREYIAALKPCGDGLLMETLRFADEVRSAAPLFASIKENRSDADLIDLARELIRRKTAPFDASAFKDRYTDALRALIDAKAKKRPAVEVDEEEPAEGAKVLDLMAALKKSVGQRGGNGSGKKRTSSTRRQRA